MPSNKLLVFGRISMAPFGSVPDYCSFACVVGDGLTGRLTRFPSMRRHKHPRLGMRDPKTFRSKSASISRELWTPLAVSHRSPMRSAWWWPLHGFFQLTEMFGSWSGASSWGQPLSKRKDLDGLLLWLLFFIVWKN